MTRLLRKFSNYFFALYPVYSREKWPRFSTSTTQKNDKFRTENFAPRSAPTTIFKLNVTSNGRRINDRTRKICSRVSSLFFFLFQKIKKTKSSPNLIRASVNTLTDTLRGRSRNFVISANLNGIGAARQNCGFEKNREL